MLTGQRLLVATGRRADLAALGVGAYGIGETAGVIPTDERMRAANGLWVIGDVAGKGAFTHVSVYQATIAARDMDQATDMPRMGIVSVAGAAGAQPSARCRHA